MMRKKRILLMGVTFLVATVALLGISVCTPNWAVPKCLSGACEPFITGYQCHLVYEPQFWDTLYAEDAELSTSYGQLMGKVILQTPIIGEIYRWN